ncbi:hypothetical protein [Orrella marina]|uniref:Uncharacterized protein n=1 Tax=Orrella marina TaxID=2163011 RepID=A0A2R4XF07_9BURK|nr:hypothetical protein [Orrella marina]AWB32404.1 hypothetical protein DBV39_00280 [Orrella marina]
MTSMMTTQSAQPVELYLDKFDYLIEQLESASEIGKLTYQNRILDASARLLMHENGLQALSDRIQRMERAGIFTGTDWNAPASLMPGLVGNTLECNVTATVTLECLSLLRFLAAATQEHRIRGLPAQKARHFLTQVLALNLDRVLGAASEASRVKENKLSRAVDRLLRHIMETVGAQGILDRLVEEVWRILSQRPLQVNPVKSMIVQISVALNEDRNGLSDARIQGADRLISALFGPTQLCRDDPGIQLYRQRLSGADRGTLQAEALGMARAMHDTGLVSDYQVEFTHFVLDSEDSDLLTHSMGLSSTGLDALRSYQPLVLSLIRESVHLGTGQALLGMSQILERGILYSPPIAPSLWRLLATKPSEMSVALLQRAFGPDIDARRTLVAGLLQMLGQPLGVGQGNNPTCQSARALSMWALNDPDYLLWLIAQVSNNDRIVMHFEGGKLDSGELPAGLAFNIPLDADAVSILLVPHLDRIYAEMGRRVADRGEDPHKWINPELHGWWVGRMFFIAVDVATGLLHDYPRFVADFYQAYHPLYNGNEPIIHPQPAGVAVTDSSGAFVGWHAITLIRVALDQSGCMRVYFFNPNNDSGQDWGHGVVVSTQGHGELPGESSLPFEDFTSRLYIFHDDGLKGSQEPHIDPAIIEKVQQKAVGSWAAQRIALTAGT